MTVPSQPGPPLTVDQQTEVDRRVRFHTRRLSIRFAVLALALAAVATFAAYRSEDAVDQLRAESTARQVSQCQSTNEFRRLFRGYLATQGNGIDPETVTTLDGFDALPPATQDYVRRLAAAAAESAAAARQVRDEYVAKFPLQDCAKLRATLEAGDTPATTTTAPVTYDTCADARAAGATPLHRGDPGYTVALDGDVDGVACE